MEDRHSVDYINPHGGADRPRNYELHGALPNRELNMDDLISPRPQSPTQEVADFLVTSPQCHFATLSCPQYVSKILSGKVNFSFKTISEIEEGLGIELFQAAAMEA